MRCPTACCPPKAETISRPPRPQRTERGRAVITAANVVIEPIEYREPVAAFAPLAREPYAMLLGGGSAGAQSQFAYIACDPFAVIERKPGNNAPDPFADVRQALRTHRIAHDGRAFPAPFLGGAVGFAGYEIANDLERLPPRKAPAFPLDLAFGLYDAVAAFDLANKKAWIISTGLPETDSIRQAARAKARAQDLRGKLGMETLPVPAPFTSAPWTADFTQAVYQERIAAIIQRIRAGEIYQANMTQRWSAPWPEGLEPFALYRRLRHTSAAPFAAYLSLRTDMHIISASPERFLSVDEKGRVETRPIKGTRPRGVSPEEDRALAAELRASPKDRAENLMIVDLLRNDISRVCVPGSVEVPTLCGLESFPAVHHLVSVVTGQLRPDATAVDLLSACFPGGSITGAPKIQAMKTIHDLEPVARGPYCGTVAWFGFDGAMDSSIVIRTLVRSGDTVAAQAGGGIVADSDPAQEYAESVLKAKPLLAALNGDGRFQCGSA
ncbi:MAG: aminodeoxychorismate synthase component I [Rhodospirillaceae bacterium]|nr:aminodeoxychorismate synthase component I [Rhodospirillaceae bacterium]